MVLPPVLLAASVGIAESGQFTPLCDGDSLPGLDGDRNHWSVRDGAIVGATSKDKTARPNS
ncbi:hypothetical protein Pla123a_39440 [Posidoniimonas polymericola]|uniref:Uncharacterized protein n=1 Tax=Posidoniimonas polymericola TaxID=2528002 RepID=A0A5C5YD18_9BACT|nr:hypothetical protein Pla123a_39440 [Posidoniimonas polymericola]